jgi:hypothetical protein
MCSKSETATWQGEEDHFHGAPDDWNFVAAALRREEMRAAGKDVDSEDQTARDDRVEHALRNYELFNELPAKTATIDQFQASSAGFAGGGVRGGGWSSRGVVVVVVVVARAADGRGRASLRATQGILASPAM